MSIDTLTRPDDADVLGAVISGALDMPYGQSNDKALHDFDLPAIVRGYLAIKQGTATETMAIAEAGYMPKLYATYKGERVRVTLVSTMGDVGISREDKSHGYFTRCSIYDLSDFSDEFHPEAPAKRKTPKTGLALVDKDGRWVRINAGNAVSPTAVSEVPVFFGGERAAYRAKRDIDPHDHKGFRLVKVAYSPVLGED